MINLLFIVEISAQTDSCSFKVEGQVLDAESKKPLSFVSVKVKEQEIYALTDKEGFFLIEGLCTQQNTIIISCYGYHDTSENVHYNHGYLAHIYLQQNVYSLKAITISVENDKITEIQSLSQETLKKEDFSTNPTKSIASAISDIAGVNVISSGTNVELPVIHGLYGNRILVLNNGIKHGFQNWSTDHAPEIDISSANSITVVKGSAGVRYGPDALGGAVIVNANPPYHDEPFKLSLGSGYQSNGKGYFTQANASQGFDKLSYHLGGKYTEIGDRNAPDYSLTNSGKKEESFFGGIHYHLDKFSVSGYYSYINQNLALLRTSVAESGSLFEKSIDASEPIFVRPFSYEINEPNQLTQHHFAKAEINWWYSDKAKITLKAAKQLNHREEYDVRRNSDKPIINLDLISNDLQLEWQHPNWKKLNGFIGYQFFSENNDNNPGTGTTPLIPNYDSYRNSLFIMESWKESKNTLELGLRMDYEYNNVRGREISQEVFRDSYTFSNLTSSLGYIKTINENKTFRSNIGTAWRIPNMAELYSFGQHGFKVNYGLLRYYTTQSGEYKTDKVTKVNDANIQPEKSYKWINEFVINNKKNKYISTFYANYIQNYVFNRPLAVIGTVRGPMPVFIFDQADALLAGLDFTWKKKWTKHISGIYGMSYLWSKNVKKNEVLINQPPVNTHYKLSYKSLELGEFMNSFFSINPSYTFRPFQAPRTVSVSDLINGNESIDASSQIFDFKDASQGYFLVDISLGTSYKNFDLSFSVNNILNTSYRNYLNQMRYFADEIGRNFLITLNYNINQKQKK